MLVSLFIFHFTGCLFVALLYSQLIDNAPEYAQYIHENRNKFFCIFTITLLIYLSWLTIVVILIRLSLKTLKG